VLLKAKVYQKILRRHAIRDRILWILAKFGDFVYKQEVEEIKKMEIILCAV